MKRYIYLDIDGVLNGHEFDYIAMSYRIQERCVRNFNLLFETFENIKVVLHSAWRYMILKETMTRRGFEYLLRTHGVHNNLTIVDCLGLDPELNMVLDNKYYTARVKLITDHIIQTSQDEDGKWKFIIFDDLPLQFSEYIQTRFIQTQAKIGLTSEDVQKAIEFLK